MRRREFIGLIGGAALVWPLAAYPQQSRKIVGVLQPQKPTSSPTPFFQAFLTRLRELGWVEDQTVHVEFRGAPRIERTAELAVDFVRMKADVIYAPNAFQVEAARRATNTIPIVFSVHGDPVGSGHVESLAKPGGNITGLTNLAIELAPKGLERARCGQQRRHVAGAARDDLEHAVVDGGPAKQRVVEIKARDPEAVRLEVAGGNLRRALRDGLNRDRPPGPVAESLLLRAGQRVDRAEKIIERALRLGIGRDGRRFQELADTARATGKPGLGGIVEVQARRGSGFFP
jgi:hypothetical protein